jgi:hypothetical protein
MGKISIMSPEFKKRLQIFLLVFLVTYVVIAVTPIAVELGRKSPKTAALFRPMLFNFMAEYRDGAVLGLEIGQSKAEVASYFAKVYGDRYRLFVRDGQTRPVNEAFLFPSSESDFLRYVGANKTVQVSMEASPKLAFILQFTEGKLNAITVYWTNHGK